MLFFLICVLNTWFFTNKINFGNLGNFVTVPGDTFISWLTFESRLNTGSIRNGGPK
jgi:hypothetical protein